MMKENETLAIQLYLFFIFLPKGLSPVTICCTTRDYIYLGAVHLTLEGASVQPNVIESSWKINGKKISHPPGPICLKAG